MLETELRQPSLPAVTALASGEALAVVKCLDCGVSFAVPRVACEGWRCIGCRARARKES